MEASTPSCRLISETISEIGRDLPQAIALRQGDRRLTYADLDLQADRFAGHLAQFGVLAGGTVALCLDRSFEWIVAALGIMRAGAAYVPLDAAWPDSRLCYAIKDSGSTVLVAPKLLLDRLNLNIHGIDPILDAEAIATAPLQTPQITPPKSIAYVIYTSGSTGTPKGVEITHANLTHLIHWHIDTFKVTHHDRASHLAGLGFDAAVWEIWPHLSAGATLCLADEAVRSSPALIQEWFLREGVTIGFVPTVHAAPLMGLPWPDRTELRFLLTGGDTLHQAPPLGLPFAVVNNYGPTECTVVSTFSVVEPDSQGAPPIGAAITGASIYLLDETGNLIADGEAGEIYIGGDGVGRGYRNLPEATERAFLPDPFSNTAGARMYRSGDRGVRRPSGEIEFRGRVDRQAKIRGQRIELDEIGGVLSRHASLEFAVVTVENEGSDARLIAYVLARKDVPPPTTSALQEHLLLSLPRYMVPAIFLNLKALPLSPNGKVDLSLLPKPIDAPLLERDAIKEPTTTTATEQKLLRLVRELLENQAITPSDNFFLAGGHSLLGMQLVLQLRKSFGMAFSLRQLFEAPTVEGLATLIDAKLAEERLRTIWSDILGTEKIGLEDDFFEAGGNAVHLATLQRRIIAEFGRRLTVVEMRENPTIRQQADLICGNLKDELTLPAGVLALQPGGKHSNLFWIHYPCENLAKAMGDERPFLFVTLTDVDVESLGSAPSIAEIASRLVPKILAVQPQGPYTLGGFCVGGILSYEVACQLRMAGHAVSLLVMLDTPSPIYYASPHLLAPRLSQPRYLVQQIARLGLRTSLTKVRERVSSRLSFKKDKGELQDLLDRVQESDPVQQMIEAAASRFAPAHYDGETVLLLASGHPPHVNFQPGWQALVGNKLRTEHVQGQHLELTQFPGVDRVADAINAHLTRTDEQPAVSHETTA